MNLALQIFYEIACRQADQGGGVGVKMSDWRKKYDIPQSTYYKAITELIEYGYIARLKRDRYAVCAYMAFLLQDAVGKDA